MKALAALLLALAAIDEGRAATAYVTDELVLGVYAAATTQGPRLATLHSGATVEALSTTGDATQVRLLDGTTGWVKTAYLTTTEPATARLKLLQDELDRAKSALEDRKVIDRAKGILMKLKGLTEDEAYVLLRSTAMREKKKIGEIAQSILTASELLK